jgi:RNA polymerase sigma factor (sigma-70 family)
MSRDLFYRFADEMNKLLRESPVSYQDQEPLLKQLFKAERAFRDELLRTRRGRESYGKFMDYILHDRGNKLAARVFFRERQDTFSRKIVRAFKARKYTNLYKFRINYLFANWVVNEARVKGRRLEELLDTIRSLRHQLCETNMPLAINRAKIFWSRVPESHLEYMDMIQACSEGLINAIDKFVPPYKPVFRSTAIGRMVSNMIDDYNSTLIKFSPKERRIIYRANNAKNRQKISKASEVVKFVNESFADVTEESLSGLMSASATAASLNDHNGDSVEVINRFAASDDVEGSAMNSELCDMLRQAMIGLGLLERKILTLKYGISMLDKGVEV